MDPTTDRLLFDLRLRRRIRLDGRTAPFALVTPAGATTAESPIHDPRMPRRIDGSAAGERRA